MHSGRHIIIEQDKLDKSDSPGVEEYPGSVPRPDVDRDWKAQLARNARQDRDACGTPHTLDGTPWVGRGRK